MTKQRWTTGTKAEHTAIDNYINGNLTEAKEQCEHLSWRGLVRVLMDDYGKSAKATSAIVDYLKGEGTFQAACDAENTLAD